MTAAPDTTAYCHVYVHVPFCARRCSYCDFAIAVRSPVPVDEFVDAVQRELAIRVPARALRAVETIYLGGGTPSRLGGDGVARVLNAVRERLEPVADAEITIEANPEDVTTEAARQWRAAGVNRVSLGVQSFEPAVLAWMHRTHDSAAIRRAAAALVDAQFDNWSLDLIYALPPEVPRDWERDLHSALALQPTHLSVYGLTVESGTPLARWRSRGEVTDASEERYERDFLVAHAVLSGAAFEHYEVSNYALPGRESRHNGSYWRDEPYLGIGPSAHGYDGARRRWNEREFVAWRSRVAAGVDPMAGQERITPDERALELTYVGLRTNRGVSVTDTDRDFIAPWLTAGWGTVHEGVLRLSPRGWLRLDALVAALTEYRSRS